MQTTYTFRAALRRRRSIPLVLTFLFASILLIGVYPHTIAAMRKWVGLPITVTTAASSGRSLALPAPGGVMTGLNLWLKADLGVTTTNGNQVNEWLDQSGAGNITNQAQASFPTDTDAITPSNDITLLSSGINFNPAVQFSGASGKSLKGNAATDWSTGATTFFAVTIEEGAVNTSGPFTTNNDWGANTSTCAGHSLVWASPPSGDTYGLDGQGCATALTASPTKVPRVVRAVYVNPTAGTGGTTALDGKVEGTGAGCGVSGGTFFEIGGRTCGDPAFDNRIFKSKIVEVVAYNSDLAAADDNRVESYLATKYGITLVQPQNYTASNSTVFWTATAPYNNDIAGIGRDDDSSLNQKQSKSVNANTLVTMGNSVIATDNASNPNNFAANRSFLLWGNDGGGLTLSGSASGGINNRVGRVWRSQETGIVGVAKISVPAAPLPAAVKYLVVSTSNTFPAGSTTYVMLTANGANLETSFDFSGVQFFSFAVGGPDLTISLGQPSPALVAGQTSNLPVTVSNIGADPTTGTITVTIPLPQNVSAPATFTSNGFTCSTVGSTVTCTSPGPINNGSSSLFNVPITPNAAAVGTTPVFNASVSTPGESNTNNNNATPVTTTVPVRPAVEFTVPTTRITLADPFQCTAPGNVVSVTATITNSGPFTQTDNPGPEFVATLPPQLVGIPNTGTATNGTVVVGATQVTWNGTVASGQTVTINYSVQVAAIPVSGQQLCITSVINYDADANGVNDSQTSVNACDTVPNCPAPPGQAYPSASQISDQKPGSVLIYNVYTSATDATRQNTRLNLTNTDASRSIAVHLFFVDGSNCSVADSFLCLTANQTTSFLASDLDPGTTGYVVAVATNASGCPISFNYLIGDEYVKFQTGHAANLGAEAISAIPGGLAFCDGNSSTATLAFDGISYNLVPHVLAADNIGSRADGNDTLLILNRIGGNLSTGASTLGTIFGLFYDDSETGVSFQLSGGSCQFRSSITNNTPRTTPRFEQFVPAGRSGWLKLWVPGLFGISGAMLTTNPNAGTSAGAFNQGHNLHKLTLTSTASYVIPVFPANCL